MTPCRTAAPTALLPRRRLMLLSLLLPLAACGGEEPTRPAFAAPDYEYLPKLRLKVGEIAINANWVPRGEGRHVEYLAPTTPRAALKLMAEQRLVAAGTEGSARFTVEDASIIRESGRYVGHLAVRLDLLDADGNETAHITARATDTHDRSGDAPELVRADLYALVQALMRDMNVEFEYQIRRVLGARLEPTDPTAPPPPPVQSEDLSTPPAAQP